MFFTALHEFTANESVPPRHVLLLHGLSVNTVGCSLELSALAQYAMPAGGGLVSSYKHKGAEKQARRAQWLIMPSVPVDACMGSER